MKRFFFSIAAAAVTLFVSAAVTPASYPGGDPAMKEYIESNLRYPAVSRDNGIEGVVSLSFTVKADGSIGAIKIVHMIDPDLEQEAIRLVKAMPRWTPASDNGSPVDSQATLQIPFSLE